MHYALEYLKNIERRFHCSQNIPAEGIKVTERPEGRPINRLVRTAWQAALLV
jgi:hypothetical protein